MMVSFTLCLSLNISYELYTRALSEITEKCPLLSNQWSFFNSVNDMIFLISLQIFLEIMKCIILHNDCLDDFKYGGETWSKEEIRAVIRFLNAKSLNPTEIHKELQSVFEHISRTQVYHWCNLFEAGHSDLTDREGRGRSTTAKSEDNVKRVDELIRQDRRLKLHEIASSLEISETSAHRIGYRKVSARWVPKQLTDNHKEQRLDI